MEGESRMVVSWSGEGGGNGGMFIKVYKVVFMLDKFLKI